MNILLKGYYGFGNFGDDLLMLISYRMLKEKYPNSAITIYANNNENLKEFNNEPKYNNYIFNILGEKVDLIDWTIRAHFDLVVEGGGGTYFDDKDSGWLYYLRNRLIGGISFAILKKIDANLRKIAKRKRKITYNRRVALGIGIGPFSKSAKNLYSCLIELISSDACMVRDESSFNLIGNLKYTHLGSDLAFCTNYWNDLFDQSAIHKPSKTIGFILKGDNTTFEQRILELALRLKKTGWKVRFFAFDDAIDKGYIDECKKLFSVDIWLPHSISLKKYISKLQKCSILLTERAHGAIVGSIIGCVPYFITPSFKVNQILSFFKNTNLNNSMLLNEELNVQLINSLYEGILKSKELLKIDFKKNYHIVSNSIRLVL